MSDFFLSKIDFMSSLEDVFNLDGFFDDNPVTEENYSVFIAEYNLSDQEAKCCFYYPDGKKCNQSHRHGFVVRLHDGTLSILGNNCATEKFAAQSEIHSHLSRWSNEKARRKKLGTFAEYVAKSDEMLEKLNEISEYLKQFRALKASLRQKIGVDFFSKMEARAKNQDPNVFVEASFVKRNNDGKVMEVIKTKNKIGIIKGLKIFDIIFCNSIVVSADILKKCLSSAVKLSLEEKVNTKKINELVSSFSDYSLLLNDFEELKALVLSFQENNPMIYCYVSDKYSARLAAAAFCLDESGVRSSKNDQAKFIRVKDDLIRSELKATSISVV